MDEQKVLELCIHCKNRSYNKSIGLVCGLSGKSPDFIGTCKDYVFVDVDYEKLNNVVYREKRFKQFVQARYRRMLNFVIDVALVSLIIYGVYNICEYYNFYLIYEVSPLAVMIFFFVLYYLLFETLLNRTPAKLLTGTKVVSKLGFKPDLSMVLVRTMLRLNPFDWMTFLNLRQIGWHDKYSDTNVVETFRPSTSDQVIDDWMQDEK